MNFNKNLLVIGMTSALTACGGGSSSSSSSESFTVTAIDGYLQNAEICVDENLNDQCDSGEEVLGTTDQNGQFTVPGRYRNAQLIVRAIAGQTIDSDSGPVTDGYEMAAPAGSDYITPFSHLAATGNTTLEDIADSLGLDLELIAGDFLAAKEGADETEVDKAEVAHAVAAFIARAIAEEQGDYLVNAGIVKLQAENDQAGGDDPSEKDYTVSGGSATGVDRPAGKFSEALLASDAFNSSTTWSVYQIKEGYVGYSSVGYAQWNWDVEGAELCMHTVGLDSTFPTVPDFTEGCSSISVSESGRLQWGTQKLVDMAYFSQKEVLDENDESVTVTTMVLTTSDGGLLYVDNHPDGPQVTEESYTSQEIAGTRYQLFDNAPYSDLAVVTETKLTFETDNTFTLEVINNPTSYILAAVESVDEPEVLAGDWWLHDLEEDGSLFGLGIDDLADVQGTSQVQFKLRGDGTLRIVKSLATSSEATSGAISVNNDQLRLESVDREALDKITSTWEAAVDESMSNYY